MPARWQWVEPTNLRFRQFEHLRLKYLKVGVETATGVVKLTSENPNAHSAERFHAFDFLRGGAMLLGVFFHAALAYADPALDYWIVQDNNRSVIFSLFAWGSHSFRMQLFFVIAGFFGALLLERYGVVRFLQQRSIRILVPFLVGVFLDNLIQKSALHAALINDLFVPHAPFLLIRAQAPLTVESYFELFDLGIYWFLEYLICFTVLSALISHYFPTTKRSDILDAAIFSKWRVVYLAIPVSVALFFTGEWGVGSPAGVLPQAVWLAYYGFFFTVGWSLFHSRNDYFRQPQLWKSDFLRALIFGALALSVGAAGHLGYVQSPILRYIAVLLTSVYTWLMIFACMGWAMATFSRESPLVRYISDSSYWMYLTHNYWVMSLQVLLSTLALFSALKYLIVVSVAFIFLTATYQLLVRHTFIGTVLNGPR